MDWQLRRPPKFWFFGPVLVILSSYGACIYIDPGVFLRITSADAPQYFLIVSSATFRTDAFLTKYHAISFQCALI